MIGKPCCQETRKGPFCVSCTSPRKCIRNGDRAGKKGRVPIVDNTVPHLGLLERSEMLYLVIDFYS